MKRLFKGIMLIIMVAILTTTSTKCVNATTDDFNWVQWYEGNGIYNVMAMVYDGEMTVTEACDLILIPANNAGILSENQKKYSLSITPKQNHTWKYMA